MNYKEAKKIKVGDVVVTDSNNRFKVVHVDDHPYCKFVSFGVSDGAYYSHAAIKEVEDPDKKHDAYFQILAFNPIDKVDEVCHSHIYPSYVSCMSIKSHYTKPCSFADMHDAPIMLQSNASDGLKFVDFYNVEKMLDVARRAYPEKEFKIIKVDALTFGRTAHRWVVSL